MSNSTNRNWSLNTAVNKELTKKLEAMAFTGAWWKKAVNVMINMVIQMLARREKTAEEIAAFIECPAECVRLIAAHYSRTIEHYANEYIQLNERSASNAGEE